MLFCRPRARTVLGTVAGVIALVLGGCGPEPAPDSPPGPLEGATISLMQYTHDQVNRVLVVKIKAGERTVRVNRVEVVSGAFTGTGPEEYDATVAAHTTLDLRVPLGEPDCAHRLSPADVAVEFETPDHDVVVDEPRGSDTLAAIHRRECAVTTAVADVPITWGSHWRTSGSGSDLVVHAPLRIGPVAADTAVRLSGIDGSVIFVPETDALPLMLDAGQTRVLDVRFRPNRCDAHVWETSRGFQFAVRLRVDGTGDEVLVPVVPARAKQQLLSRYWQEQCGVRR
ncbi:hypothetical protein BJ980_000595 [Nocardioides daedukensis]|uniref:Lipoprotein n=1 Tax=Nocardioides daedukensis TaxID=634462 RepID=A0A7Y9UNZ0_9ACTN|nr:hypothetical protein [Nocardioides daedukensis]NYG57672.1 hypothetical protein [Nocardioides daedukensis]